jgi:sugar (pentulose or hexulose) kinase
MTKDLLLAIDNGTQSVRALVYDLQGNLVARNQVLIEPYYSTQPGLAEQDPDLFWRALCQACQGLWAREAPGLRERIAGMALTTQLTYRMTGRFADSVGAQVGYLPFDFKRQRWAGAFDWKWQALPVGRAQMPDLVPVGAIIGRLTPEAAAEMGLAHRPARSSPPAPTRPARSSAQAPSPPMSLPCPMAPRRRLT